jgi:putative zinc finger protein
VIADLGGPGPACSALRVRRFDAGELSGVERERMQAHLEGCARCQAALREIEGEKARLLRDVPFEQFAAGVAEKLAVTHSPRKVWRKFVPLAAAAALLIGIGIGRGGGNRDDERTRTKGGTSARLYEKAGAEVIAVGPDGVVGTGPLQFELASPDRPQAVLLLVEGHDASILYAGPSQGARAPFEWVGPANRATLVTILSDRPLDAESVRRAVAERGIAGAPKDSEVLARPLVRGMR